MSRTKKPELEDLEKIIGYSFKKSELLLEALTHRSYLNERSDWPQNHNERLEFLGDAVLELIVTRVLFLEYPEEPEGKLTSVRAALVNYQTLAKVAAEMRLGNFIFMSKGEAQAEGRARATILANAMEALIGAVYLDGGLKASTRLVVEKLMPRLPEVMEKELYRDAKSRLQEIIQERERVTPVYEVLAETGPDHNKVFRVGVFKGEEKMGEGTGYSKQEAETKAAEEALEKMGWRR